MHIDSRKSANSRSQTAARYRQQPRTSASTRKAGRASQTPRSSRPSYSPSFPYRIYPVTKLACPVQRGRTGQDRGRTRIVGNLSEARPSRLTSPMHAKLRDMRSESIPNSDRRHDTQPSRHLQALRMALLPRAQWRRAERKASQQQTPHPREATSHYRPSWPPLWQAYGGARRRTGHSVGREAGSQNRALQEDRLDPPDLPVGTYDTAQTSSWPTWRDIAQGEDSRRLSLSAARHTLAASSESSKSRTTPKKGTSWRGGFGRVGRSRAAQAASSRQRHITIDGSA